MKKIDKSAFELAISSILADAVTKAVAAAKADFAARAASMFGGDLAAPSAPAAKRARVCKVEGCRKAAKGPRFKWLCAEHYEEQKANPPAVVAPTEKRKPGRPKRAVAAAPNVEPAAVATVPTAAATNASVPPAAATAVATTP